MAIFLSLNETDSEGKFLRNTVVNADAIVSVHAIGAEHCLLLMQSYPSESIYVAGSLKDVLESIISNSLPPTRAPGR
jgi:hypothetical protein